MRYTGRLSGKLYVDDGTLLRYEEECHGTVFGGVLVDGRYELRVEELPGVVFRGADRNEVLGRLHAWVRDSLRRAARPNSSPRPDEEGEGADDRERRTDSDG